MLKCKLYYYSTSHLIVAMGIERLQFLFRYCNAVGLFPHRMVINSTNDRFQRFDVHWRHPSNWWFLALLIAQIVYIIITIYTQIFIFVSQSELSAIYSIIWVLGLVNYILMIPVPRFFLFHFRHFETALETLNQVDRLLAKNSNKIPRDDGIKRRIIFGIFASFFWVLFSFLNVFF